MTGIEKSIFSTDATLLFIHAKIDQYRGEIDFFEHKYKLDFQQLEKNVHFARGQEDFQVEEDLVDWEFAIQSLKYWQGEYLKIKTDAAVA